MGRLQYTSLGILGLVLLGCQPNHHKPTLHHDAPRQLCMNQPLTHQPTGLKLTHLAKKIIQPVIRGDEILLLLPTDYLFKPHSDRLSARGLAVLNEIGGLLQSVSGPIFITGHTDTIGSHADKQSLSHRQAQRIVTYFWGQGFNHRQFITRGAGDLEPITEQSIDGSATNRRIEISYRAQTSM